MRISQQSIPTLISSMIGIALEISSNVSERKNVRGAVGPTGMWFVSVPTMNLSRRRKAVSTGFRAREVSSEVELVFLDVEGWCGLEDVPAGIGTVRETNSCEEHSR